MLPLESHRWQLKHAYGAAGGIPDLLRQLESNLEEKPRSRAVVHALEFTLPPGRRLQRLIRCSAVRPPPCREARDPRVVFVPSVRGLCRVLPEEGRGRDPGRSSGRLLRRAEANPGDNRARQ